MQIESHYVYILALGSTLCLEKSFSLLHVAVFYEYSLKNNGPFVSVQTFHIHYPLEGHLDYFQFVSIGNNDILKRSLHLSTRANFSPLLWPYSVKGCAHLQLYRITARLFSKIVASIGDFAALFFFLYISFSLSFLP